MNEIMQAITDYLEPLNREGRINAINQLRQHIHQHSPFKEHPVDCVLWVLQDAVQGNDYNPNAVAEQEMNLLRTSIEADGYTQPIVVYPESVGNYTIVDGFHRHLVGKELLEGYLPVTEIRASQSQRDARMASTVRHNRARGKHSVDLMMSMVSELVKQNWSDTKIAKELGMDADEVLRFKQISGLADLFQGQDYSEAWVVESVQDLDT